MRTWKAYTFLLEFIFVVFALLSSWTQPRADVNVSIAMTEGNKWSAKELGTMALGKDMAAVVSRMAGIDEGQDDSGVPVPSEERVQERVSQVTVADIRKAILAEASNALFGRQRNLAKFVATDDPAATCATTDTAGWGGIDECTTQCASKRSVTRKAPHEGACHALCTLAIDPCVKMNSSWTSRAEKWNSDLYAWMEMVLPATAAASLMHPLMWLMLLEFLLAAHMANNSMDLSVQKRGARRVEHSLASTRDQRAAIVKSRIFQPRKRRARQESLYHRDGVSAEVCRGIAKAKRDAVRRRMGCNLLPMGLLTRRQEKASVAARFARWKGETVTGGGKVAASDSGGAVSGPAS